MGNRLSAQIEKGAWRVEMDLHPRSLGRIEIQLEMRNGELEAYFNSNQNLTRDLLSESFSKLREIKLLYNRAIIIFGIVSRLMMDGLIFQLEILIIL